jgi:hypothetical protein
MSRARELTAHQVSIWQSTLEALGFVVASETMQPEDEGRSCSFTLRAERGATRIEIEAAVTVREDGPAWSVRAPLYRGDKQVMTIRTMLLLAPERLSELVSRLERMDQEKPTMEFGPSTWSAKTKSAPALSGGVQLARARSNEKTHKILEVLTRGASTIYSIVASAQVIEPNITPQGNAQQEVVLATGALMAAEIEAFVQLTALGLEGPAQVHARAVGDFATRIAMFRADAELALRVYESFPASIVEILEQFRDDDKPTAGVAGGIPDKSMRKIENEMAYRDARNTIAAKEHLLSLAEHGVFSKRTHGDVTAMALVAGALATRGGDVREAIARTTVNPADNEITVRSSIIRVLGWTLHAAVDIINVLPLEPAESLEELAKAHSYWQHNLDD